MSARPKGGEVDHCSCPNLETRGHTSHTPISINDFKLSIIISLSVRLQNRAGRAKSHQAPRDNAYAQGEDMIK